MNEVLKTIAAKYKDDIVHTVSELIQRNSQSLHEGEVAAYVQEKMKELGYDKVEVDGLGPGDWLWAEAQQRERLAIPSAFEKFTAELKEGE